MGKLWRSTVFFLVLLFVGQAHAQSASESPASSSSGFNNFVTYGYGTTGPHKLPWYADPSLLPLSTYEEACMLAVLDAVKACEQQSNNWRACQAVPPPDIASTPWGDILEAPFVSVKARQIPSWNGQEWTYNSFELECNVWIGCSCKQYYH